MSDSECSSDEDQYVFYKDREEWKDVTPVKQDDGPRPLVVINYTQKFVDAHDYFRAIVQSGEISQRCLDLTTNCIKQNPANYSAWRVRRHLLHSLQKDLKEDMPFTKKMAIKYPKNYQVWFHRHALVEYLNDASEELEFTQALLDNDSKNYHAWTHRQWVIKKFNLFSNELEFIDNMLTEDIRNNSAWNQRNFVIVNTTGYTPEVVAREIEYSLTKIKLSPNNESPWNYLRGAIMYGRQYKDYPIIKTTLDGLNENPRLSSPALLGMLAEMHEQEKETKCLEYYLQLQKTDAIRQKYWIYRHEKAEAKLAAA